MILRLKIASLKYICMLCHSLAEFIIMLGDRNGSLDKFKAALKENGAEFPVS